MGTAERALRFLALFSEIQESCDLLISRRLDSAGESFAAVIAARLTRLTDKERIQAAAALAADVGSADRFANVVSVLLDLKKLRDRIGHSTLLGLSSDDPNAPLFSHKDDAMEITSDELGVAYWRAWWVLEQVSLVMEEAAIGSHDGTPFTRKSGALMRDDAPSVNPPKGRLRDPMVLWEVLEDDSSDEQATA